MFFRKANNNNETSQQILPIMIQHSPIRTNVMSIVCKTLTLQTVEFEEDLIDTGQLDSLSLVQLMVALEEEFNIRIEPEELDFEDYRSVKSITEMVTRISRLNSLTISVSG